ncbi:hypothetical protein OG742_11370 [Streptomyces sp. NBC_00828]|uniref:hypothetical protein n=1 Tax=Streptomyces sp. NBC_00828 TaxID=2903678 RepID=UPI0038682C3E
MTDVPTDKKTIAVPAWELDKAVANTIKHVREDHARHVTPPPAPLLADADLPNRRR